MAASRLLFLPLAAALLTVAGPTVFAAAPAKHASAVRAGTRTAKKVRLDRETPDIANAIRLDTALGNRTSRASVLQAMRAAAARHPASLAAYETDLAAALHISRVRLAAALTSVEHPRSAAAEGVDGSARDN